MTSDPTLSGLIDQNRLSRMTYYVRKEQESLPRIVGQTAAAQRVITENANAAWKIAEIALWRYVAAH